ncbi:MAG: polysaccharide deacetylase family protein, partial [Candidatus Nanohaloarchaea archaeon]|nr:polysaccharide deacetylase family protein [Candidatus Nanohaloarchaea archaeon]
MEKIALSIDTEFLETNQYKYSASGTAEKEKEGLRDLLEILDRHDQRITFFTVANMCNDHKDILEEIVDRGHEIGSHTMNHKDLTELSGKELEEEVIGSKEKLEEELGVEVKGFRAPMLKHNEEVFSNVKKAGYSYDSSMISSLRIPGWYGGDNVGQKPFKRGGLTEVPLSVHPWFKIPISGFFARCLGKRYLMWSIKLLHGRDITPVIYLHPFALKRFENKNNWRQRMGAGRYTLDLIETLAGEYTLVRTE